MHTFKFCIIKLKVIFFKPFNLIFDIWWCVLIKDLVKSTSSKVKSLNKQHKHRKQEISLLVV